MSIIGPQRVRVVSCVCLVLVAMLCTQDGLSAVPAKQGGVAASRPVLPEAEGDLEPIWVLIPTAQQISGAWIDDILASRVEEKGIARYSMAAQFPRQRVEVVRARDTEAAVNELFYKRGWTDGLPIVAPSLGKVAQMLRYTDRSRYEVVGELDPLKGQATIEKIAINAVMAGCRPEYLPIVIAVVEALADPDFNLRGVQTTDENVTPLIIINGPIAKELDINGSFGALGPGWQANATIGRAVRLIMNNVGGGWPWAVSLAGLGQAGRYTMCLAENEAVTPWPPLHVELGFAEDANTVTVLRAETAINVTGGLAEIASVMGSMASAFTIVTRGKVTVAVAPYVAAQLAAQGWTKDDVKEYLYEHGRLSLQEWEESWLSDLIGNEGRRDRIVQAAKEGEIPAVASPEDITVIVAGGDMPIPQHAYFPSWGHPPCRITREIELPRDWARLMEQRQP
jgi:hypothetical protein